MKKLSLLLVLLLLSGAVPGLSHAEAGFDLPEDSGVFSPVLAGQLLTFSSGYTAEGTAASLRAAGFEPVLQDHYDKPDSDVSHTCAFSLGKKTVLTPGGLKTVYLLIIRGTNTGEWYSNFDFAPSRNESTRFAENYLYCAQDVLLSVQDEVLSDPEAIWIVTGYSRGAACANLLGLLLNGLRDPALNYIYTSATPNTLRGEDLPGTTDRNIFNLINPLDLVPRLPLSAWGYRRAGTDMLLPGDPEAAARLDAETEDLAALAPTVTEYYTVRHLLTGPGTGEDGLTAFEVMTAFGEALAGMRLDTSGGVALSDSLPDGLSEGSDFAPLFSSLRSLSKGDAGKRLLMQHMPDTYGLLLKQAFAGPIGGAN